jgi:hypothetical protein
MIVYGDGARPEEAGRLLAALRDDCAALEGPPPGVERRSAGTRLLIAAGELAQGLLDDAFAARGGDDWGEREEACARLTLAAARLTLGTAGVEEVRDALGALGGLPLPAAVTVKVPEGYAFYALYPEQYALAARQLAARHAGPVVVVGLRSIGTSLAAVVAAALHSPIPPVTLRPVGHPFQRTLQVGPRLASLLLAQPAGTHFAIVDEGPGLSGSSFGAVADWLEDRGVAPDRIHFFPGHGGDLGPQASPRHRERWRRADRLVVPFETLLQSQGCAPFAGGPAQDISGGRWRALHFPSPDGWPPTWAAQERRKYLYRADGRTWLAKFAGLGRHGGAKLERARRLAAAGLVPPPRGLRDGFLVEEWLDGARPLPLAADVPRVARIEAAAEYLGLLAREFPARSAGASPEELLRMARVNSEELFGPELPSALDRWGGRLGEVAAALRPVETDNRMHAWEWLALPGGRLVKCDALDHHAGHDLIGAQDLAWDVVGAAVEWGLDAAEQAALQDRLARLSRYRPRPLLTEFYRGCYLAFQAGYYTMAAQSQAEALRCRAAAGRYAEALRRWLAGHG